MGNSISNIKRITYREIQNNYIPKNSDYILINTLSDSEQDCLINNTVTSNNEIKEINILIKNKNMKSINICIYGQNYNDERIITQYNKLKSLGFKNISIYPGGMFEWLCLQEIYGDELFPTTTHVLDILKYEP